MHRKYLKIKNKWRHARLLILSSLVSYSHIGLSAGQPVCQRLSIDVTVLPTTLISNHLGWSHVAGSAVPADQITVMAEALNANTWLSEHDRLLVDYMPSRAHVVAAETLIHRLRDASKTAQITLDSILGDHPNGLYIPEEVAQAVQERLLPWPIRSPPISSN